MNSINQLPSKAYPVVGAIRPQQVADGASVSTGYVDAADGLAFARALLNLGVAGASVVNVKVEQAQSAAGLNVKDLLTAAQTGIAAYTDDNTDKEFEFRPHEILDLDNGFTFFRVTATVTGAAGALLALQLQYGPARYQS